MQGVLTPAEPRATACLDHAATTPMHPDALAVMSLHLAAAGTPSALHSSGRHAQRVVEEARDVCSACRPRPSRILLAMGAHESDARCNLRVTLGHTTTRAEVDAFVDAIGPVVDRARARSTAGGPVRIQQGVLG